MTTTSTMVHTRATHATRARVSPARYGAHRGDRHRGSTPSRRQKCQSARADREKAFKEKHSRVDFLMQGFFFSITINRKTSYESPRKLFPRTASSATRASRTEGTCADRNIPRARTLSPGHGHPRGGERTVQTDEHVRCSHSLHVLDLRCGKLIRREYRDGRFVEGVCNIERC